MYTVSAVGGGSVGGRLYVNTAPVSGAGMAAESKQGSVTPGSITESATFSAASLHTSQETLIGTYGGALSNRELLGALLLMLTLEHLLGDKDSEAGKSLLLLALLSTLPQPETGGFMYSRSEMSLETMQLQTASSMAWAGQPLDAAYGQSTLPAARGASLDVAG
jgi:hypothetical protein